MGAKKGDGRKKGGMYVLAVVHACGEFDSPPLAGACTEVASGWYSEIRGPIRFLGNTTTGYHNTQDKK